MSTPKGQNAINSIDASYQAVPQQNYGAFSSAWRFLNEDETLQEQQYGQLVQLYGQGLRIFDAWMWANRYISIGGRSVQVIEEGAFLDTLNLTAAIATNSAGANISIETTKGYGRVGFIVHIPAQYTGAEVAVSYRISAKSYAGGTYTYTAQAVVGTEQITTEIPIGQKLMVGGSMFAPGTQQPAGLVEDYFDHWHYTRIMKETINEEGGQQALTERPEMGQSQFGSNMHARNLVKAQLRLRHQINDFVLMGYPNQRVANSLADITQANRWGEANSVSGDFGLIPSMATNAMKQYYTGTYTEDNFDTIKFLLASQGVTGSQGLYMHGQELGLSIENSGLRFIREYSGGSDMYDKLKGVGFNIKEVLKNNFKTYLMEVPEFSNPLTYAANGYNFETLGMIFPESKVTTTLNTFMPSGQASEGKKVSLNHLAIGYLSGNGEDRKLVVGNKAGVNGRGIPISDDWDDASTYMLTEAMVFLLAMNQTILVLRTDQ